MIPLLLVAGGLLWWMWRRGELSGLTTNDVAAGIAGLIGVWILLKGELISGALLLGSAALWLGRSRFARPLRPVIGMKVDEARRVLNLPVGADAAAIKAAHKRLVARVHPDQGGSAELAARVNAARDTLLAELGNRRRG